MRTLALIILLACPVLNATPAGQIIQISRKLRLSPKEPLPEKEFYIDLGSRDGIREGDILSVGRKVPVVDATHGADWHLLQTDLGELKVILVGETLSLARVQRVREPAELPPVDYTQFMLGDEVKLKADLPFSSDSQ